MARPVLKTGGTTTAIQQAGRRIMRWRFLAEVWDELRKSQWPTRQEAIRLTLIVVALSVAVGIVLALLDFLFSLLVNRLFIGA